MPETDLLNQGIAAYRAGDRARALYRGKSNARPVDIAVADMGDTSLVIMMFSHPDEHEALFSTVFLPILCSIK
jgi:hypothetical protein